MREILLRINSDPTIKRPKLSHPFFNKSFAWDTWSTAGDQPGPRVPQELDTLLPGGMRCGCWSAGRVPFFLRPLLCSQTPLNLPVEGPDPSMDVLEGFAGLKARHLNSQLEVVGSSGAATWFSANRKGALLFFSQRLQAVGGAV